MTLSGYVVVVTGASKGIGKEIALRAATEGANIVINYLSDVKAANALVMHVGPERALAVQVDISSVEGANTLIDAAVSRFGKVDILIPNAAFVPDRNLQDVCEADIDRAFAVNVKGPCFLTQVSYHQAPCLRIGWGSRSDADRFPESPPSHATWWRDHLHLDRHDRRGRCATPFPALRVSQGSNEPNG